MKARTRPATRKPKPPKVPKLWGVYHTIDGRSAWLWSSLNGAPALLSYWTRKYAMKAAAEISAVNDDKKLYVASLN